jgi:hypothetical protein
MKVARYEVPGISRRVTGPGGHGMIGFSAAQSRNERRRKSRSWTRLGVLSVRRTRRSYRPLRDGSPLFQIPGTSYLATLI